MKKSKFEIVKKRSVVQQPVQHSHKVKTKVRLLPERPVFEKTFTVSWSEDDGTDSFERKCRAQAKKIADTLLFELPCAVVDQVFARLLDWAADSDSYSVPPGTKRRVLAAFKL